MGECHAGERNASNICCLRRTFFQVTEYTRNKKAMRFRMASPMVRRALPALVNSAVKALCIAALVCLAICVFVIVLVAVGWDVPAIGMPEVVALRWTKAVSGTPVDRSIINPVLIAVLSRR